MIYQVITSYDSCKVRRDSPVCLVAVVDGVLHRAQATYRDDSWCLLREHECPQCIHWRGFDENSDTHSSAACDRTTQSLAARTHGAWRPVFEANLLRQPDTLSSACCVTTVARTR